MKTLSDITEELEADLRKAKVAYEEAKIAVEFFKRKYGAESPNDAAALNSENIVTTDNHKETKPTIHPMPAESKKSFRETVMDVVNSFGDDEFTGQEVYDALDKIGLAPNAKNPRASIAHALTILEERGVVKRTFVGSGSISHKFKIAKESKKQNVLNNSSELFQ